MSGAPKVDTTTYRMRFLGAQDQVLQRSIYQASDLRDALRQASIAPMPTDAVKVTIAPDPHELATPSHAKPEGALL